MSRDQENYLTVTVGGKSDRKHTPMPSREELMSRNSFGSVNNNKYLNRWLRQGGAA
ncbi:DUF2737 family protein [Cronobacter sakazakii]|uniref:DUF2737 family protein n=1 Tax=Cronobacter sakazakii TaxID=28141 RepID=UPI002894ECBD|nr:DUF2737 family protein [Cronobacter sakazakii]MDT3523229.1 DUF2737 family protein [Cronobacter sakazakii]